MVARRCAPCMVARRCAHAFRNPIPHARDCRGARPCAPTNGRHRFGECVGATMVGAVDGLMTIVGGARRYTPRMVARRYTPRMVARRYTPRMVARCRGARPCAPTDGRHRFGECVGATMVGVVDGLMTIVGGARRYTPRMVARRYTPRMVARRYTPRMVVRRYTPRMVARCRGARPCAPTYHASPAAYPPPRAPIPNRASLHAAHSMLRSTTVLHPNRKNGCPIDKQRTPNR